MRGEIVKNFVEKDIVKCTVTGVQKYGVFVSVDDEYDGLIHISEISYAFVKDVNDFVELGEDVYAEVIDVDNEHNRLKLSIKDIDYKYTGMRLERMAETRSGFEPLKEHLDEWINDKIKEITDKM